jgi:hypothetical protein
MPPENLKRSQVSARPARQSRVFLESGKSWGMAFAAWRSTDPKFCWNRMPLRPIPHPRLRSNNFRRRRGPHPRGFDVPDCWARYPSLPFICCLVHSACPLGSEHSVASGSSFSVSLLSVAGTRSSNEAMKSLREKFSGQASLLPGVCSIESDNQLTIFRRFRDKLKGSGRYRCRCEAV